MATPNEGRPGGNQTRYAKSAAPAAVALIGMTRRGSAAPDLPAASTGAFDSTTWPREIPHTLGTESRITDRKSTRLNSSHANISYVVFCLNKKNHFISS